MTDLQDLMALLPKLPHTNLIHMHGADFIDVYTGDQMRAYALEAAAQPSPTTRNRAMDEHTVRVFGYMLAEYARIEGMKAENMQRQALGESMAYGEAAFNIEARHLDELARQL